MYIYTRKNVYLNQEKCIFKPEKMYIYTRKNVYFNQEKSIFEPQECLIETGKISVWKLLRIGCLDGSQSPVVRSQTATGKKKTYQ